MTKIYLITTEDGNNKLEEKNILVWPFHAFVYNPSLKKKMYTIFTCNCRTINVLNQTCLLPKLKLEIHYWKTKPFHYFFPDILGTVFNQIV